MRVLGAPLLAAVLAAGCSGGRAAKPAPTPPPLTFKHPLPRVPGADRADAGQTITYYGESVGIGSRFDQLFAAEYGRETGVKVRFIPRPTSASECYAAYQRILQAKSSDVDVFELDTIWSGAFAPHLRDLRPELGALDMASFPAIAANGVVGGKLVAVPLYTNAGLLFYRTDLLEKYGYTHPPATWDELEAMAKRIQGGERRTNRHFVGWVWQGNAYEGLTCDALEWQVSSGAPPFVDAAGAHVDGPRAIAAFKRAAAWVGTISPDGVTSYMEEDARNVFQGGNAAFMRNWPYCYAAGNAPTSPIRGKFEATVLPHAADATRSAATLGGANIGVSAYTRHARAALRFVAYMASPAAQAWRAEEGSYLPSIRAVYSDRDALSANPFLKVMPEVLEQAVARPSARTGDRYNEASTTYFQGVAEILQGGDPAFVTSKMKRDLDEILTSD